MTWSLFALAASVIFAASGQVNRRLGMPGAVLNAYRGAAPFLALLPCLIFIAPPDAWRFYALTALNGLIISFADARFFDATARFGAAQTLRLQPLVLVLVFVFWAPLDWEHTRRMLANPPLALAVGAALTAASVSLFFMTRAPVTREALRFYLPAILATALIDPINKLTTRYTHGLPGALCYVIFTSFFVFLFVAPRMVWRRRLGGEGGLIAEFTKPGYVVAGLLIGGLSIAFNIAKNLAMAATPNPVFVTAVIFCSGVWATLYARMRGEPDEYNPMGAAAFIISAIVLALLGGAA
jgi:hypothetical protein